MLLLNFNDIVTMLQDPRNSYSRPRRDHINEFINQCNNTDLSAIGLNYNILRQAISNFQNNNIITVTDSNPSIAINQDFISVSSTSSNSTVVPKNSNISSISIPQTRSLQTPLPTNQQSMASSLHPIPSLTTTPPIHLNRNVNQHARSSKIQIYFYFLIITFFKYLFIDIDTGYLQSYREATTDSWFLHDFISYMLRQDENDDPPIFQSEELVINFWPEGRNYREVANNIRDLLQQEVNIQQLYARFIQPDINHLNNYIQEMLLLDFVNIKNKLLTYSAVRRKHITEFMNQFQDADLWDELHQEINLVHQTIFNFKNNVPNTASNQDIRLLSSSSSSSSSAAPPEQLSSEDQPRYPMRPAAATTAATASPTNEPYHPNQQPNPQLPSNAPPQSQQHGTEPIIGNSTIPLAKHVQLMDVQGVTPLDISSGKRILCGGDPGNYNGILNMTRNEMPINNPYFRSIVKSDKQHDRNSNRTRNKNRYNNRNRNCNGRKNGNQNRSKKSKPNMFSNPNHTFNINQERHDYVEWSISRKTYFDKLKLNHLKKRRALITTAIAGVNPNPQINNYEHVVNWKNHIPTIKGNSSHQTERYLRYVWKNEIWIVLDPNGPDPNGPDPDEPDPIPNELFNVNHHSPDLNEPYRKINKDVEADERMKSLYYEQFLNKKRFLSAFVEDMIRKLCFDKSGKKRILNPSQLVICLGNSKFKTSGLSQELIYEEMISRASNPKDPFYDMKIIKVEEYNTSCVCPFCEYYIKVAHVNSDNDKSAIRWKREHNTDNNFDPRLLRPLVLGDRIKARGQRNILRCQGCMKIMSRDTTVAAKNMIKLVEYAINNNGARHPMFCNPLPVNHFDNRAVAIRNIMNSAAGKFAVLYNYF